MQAVILAAGKGTRLHPITEKRSKAMTPLVGKPIVERVMESCMRNGIHEFILVVSKVDQAITDYFQAATHLEAQVQFVFQEERLGMANALSMAAPYIHGPFLLSACDTILPTAQIGAMLSTYAAREANAVLGLMAVPHEAIPSTAVVEMVGDEIIGIVEKPEPDEAPSNIASLPVYMLSNRLLGYLPEVPISPRGEYELQDAIQLLIQREQRVFGTYISERLELTNIHDFLKLTKHFLDQEAANGVNHTATPSIGQDGKFIPPYFIAPGVTIGVGCEIGPYVYIEEGVVIGDNVTVQEAAVLHGGSVSNNEVLIGRVIS